MMSNSSSYTYPSRFLQQLEWVMIGVCGSMGIVDAFYGHHVPVLHISILAILGGMGFFVPTKGKTWVKVLYTGVQLNLIFYGTLMGYLHVLPVLYLIVVIRSCFIFEMSGRWLTTEISMICFLFHQVQYGINIVPLLLPQGLQAFLMHQISEVLMFGLGLALVLHLANTVLSERMLKHRLESAFTELSDTCEQLHESAFQIEEMAAIKERNNIAREIHDSLGHALTTLNLQLQMAIRYWSIELEVAKEAVQNAQALGDLAMEEVRRSVGALHDGIPEIPLNERILTLADNFQRNTGIGVNLQQADLTFSSQPVRKTVYRILQEALTNISKHSEATEVSIEVSSTQQELFLRIQDNGQGFNIEEITPGLGLKSMRDRTNGFGGSFQLSSSHGLGCQISVDLPLIEVHDDHSSVDCGRPAAHPS
jgi:signal transduction histidine kinase